MSLKISIDNETFDFSKDFSIEIEDSSPIYNERGSQTIAATIPGTKKNLRLNKHITRIDTDLAPAADARTVVADGVYHRVGKMNTVSASKSEGITFNVGFGESELYSIWNAVSLQSLKMPTYAPPGGAAELCAYLESIFRRQNTNTPFCVFPVSLSCNVKEEAGNNKEYHEYLNQGADYGKLIWEARTEQFVISGEITEVSLPAGYGVSPFLKVSYILQTIFENYGYTVIENPFTDQHQLKELVVLNNAADCCVKGHLNYTELMPQCTINEFMQALWCRFGLLYFVDGNTRSVRLKFLRDILRSTPVEDWTLLKSSNPIIHYEAPRQLKLSASTNIQSDVPYYVAAPAADSLDKFLKPYSYIVSTKDDAYLKYSPTNGRYHKRDNVTGQSTFVSSDFFPWDRGAEMSYQEITSVDESLPVTGVVFGSSNKYSSRLPLYLVGKVHRHTTITSSDVSLSENLNTQTPLCFCFAFPSFSYTEGSSICVSSNLKPVVDKNGNIYDISLTFVGKYGLFQHFWREYDAILRHANHLIESDIHLSAGQCMNPVFYTPVLFNGQRLLPDSIRYTLPRDASQPSGVKFRTLKLLKPYDLEKEQTVPVIDQKYKWVLFDNKNAVVEAAVKEQKDAWRTEANKDGNSLHDLQYKNITSDTVEIQIPLSVPTEAEYTNKKEYFIRKVNYGFDLYYRIKIYLGASGGTIHWDISDPKGGVRYNLQYDQYVRAELL